jgi:hypothetical protein
VEYLEENWGDRVDKSSARSTVTRTLGREAEESVPVDAVTREWLVKTQQAGKT